MSKPSSPTFRRKRVTVALIIGLVLAVIGAGQLLIHKPNLPKIANLPDLPVELPTVMPSDVKLSKAEIIAHPFSPYHQYTYTGNNRVIVIVDQLSGWNFDPEKPLRLCLTATPLRPQ